MTRIPKVAAVHDLSCVGRCSLTVILPILSCMGVQACPLPTAVLSTHLGGFRDVAFHDFTHAMPDFAQHWRRENIAFDCIYSGFLASAAQIEVVSRFIDEFSANQPLVLVDPVMGDGGRLYSTYTAAMQDCIRSLVRQADIITPNYTEACFLLSEPYQDTVACPDSLKSWLPRLAAMGPERVVITGIPLPGKRLANLCYEAATRQSDASVRDLIPASYPGTGDVFASVLLGELLRGTALPAAVRAADSFVAAAVQDTFLAGTPTREGVLLERCLGKLCRAAESQLTSGGN